MRRLAIALALAAAACQPVGTVTPAGTGNRVSAKAVINASVDVTFASTLQIIGDEGLTIRGSDEERGEVETEYFDLSDHGELDAEHYPDAQRQIRLIFTVTPDTLGRGTRATASAVYDPVPFGITGSRGRERLVPSDHPGTDYAKRLLDKIERSALHADRGH